MFINKINVSLMCAALYFFTSSAFAETKIIPNYDQLLQTLEAGNKVRAIIHFDQCKLESGGGLSSISGGVNFDIFNHYNMKIDSSHTKEVISVSNTVFSVTDLQNFGPVMNYVWLHVFKDNTAQLFWALLDPNTYEKKVSVSYLCPIGNELNQSGVVLYNTSS